MGPFLCLLNDAARRINSARELASKERATESDAELVKIWDHLVLANQDILGGMFELLGAGPPHPSSKGGA